MHFLQFKIQFRLSKRIKSINRFNLNQKSQIHLNIKFNVWLQIMNLIVTLKILFAMNLVYIRRHVLLKKVKTVILFLIKQKMMYAL